MSLFDIFRKKKVQLTEEQLKWNKMWDLWTQEKIESPYRELMTYQSEINNGGHDQYFLNVGNTKEIEKEISALERILPSELKDNLRKAYKAYLVSEECAENKKTEEISEQCDDTFFQKEEEINSILEKYASSVEL